ncbi:MAG: protein kinase [Deltaproteobacteria bacterium]|nr:protein kinase [Deltaproteobacteria bacterium]
MATLLAGKYELIHRIAQGGMAEVFLARQTGIRGFEKLVVVKRILPHIAHNPAFEQMFLDEARTAADLRHPNVVSIHEVGEDGGTYFMAMEFLHGQDARRILVRVAEQGGSIPLAHALGIIVDAAAGLQHAHVKADLHGRPLGIVHRDISPHNLIVTYDGVTKIVDFGVAKAAVQTEDTATGVLKGKYSYMSPEQAGGQPVDARSDQFALGIVLWELCTMQRLFKRDSDILALHAIMECRVPRPSSVVPGFPRDLDPVVMKALSPRREDRFRDCEDLGGALEEWLARHGVPHSPARLGAWMRALFADALAADPATMAAATMASQVSVDEGQRTKSDRAVAATAATGTGTGGGSVSASEPGQDTVVDVRRGNVPPVDGGFVGRDNDLQALGGFLAQGKRVVTVLGPGGIGKSRLCLQYASLHRSDYDALGGAWLCDLSDATNLEQVCAAVGRGLEIPLTAGRTVADVVDQLGAALARRGRLLVVLENFDQVVQHGAGSVGRWLALAPRAEFLVSSREPLHLPQEQPWHLGPLALPERDEDADQSEAVKLFVERARAVRQGFVLTPAEKPLVAQIVRELDGIPLAIELAAARMGVLSAQKLLERLPRRFDLLTGGKRDGSSSRSTLRGAIDWSWKLLQPHEQAALGMCSVFRGDFSLEAAEEVVSLERFPGSPWVLDVLEALRDKSLLRAVESRHFPGEMRFSLYVSIREYAHEKLAALPEAATVPGRHAEYYLRAGEAWAEGVDGHGGMERLKRLAGEQENLLAVHARAMKEAPSSKEAVGRALRALLVLQPVLSTRGPFATHLALLDDTLAAAARVAADPSLHARVLDARARARHARGRLAEARADGDAAVALARKAGDRRAEAVALDELGKLAQDRGAKDEARPLHDQSLAIFRDIGGTGGAARALQQLGGMLHDERRLAEAHDHYERALAMFRECGDRRGEGSVTGYLGILNHEWAKLAPARTYYEKAYAIFREVEDLRLQGIMLGYLGILYENQGRLDRARSQFLKAVAVLREANDRRYEGIFLGNLGAVEAVQGRFEDARRSLDEARSLLAAAEDPLFLAALDLHAAHLEVAEARRAHARGDHAGAARLLARVKAQMDAAEAEPVGGGRPLVAQTDEIRFALRFLSATWRDANGALAAGPR